MKTIVKPKTIIAFLLLIVAICMPLATSVSYFESLFIITFIWIVVNQGFNIIIGYTGYCSLVQGGLFGVGAYVTAILTTGCATNVWLAGLIAIVVVTLFAWGLALVVFRTYGGFFAILTLVMALVFFEFFNNLSITGASNGILNVPHLFPGSWPKLTFYYFVLFVVLVSVAFVVWLKNTRLGYAMKGIGSNEKLASSVGISLYKYKTASLILASIYAGVGGVLYVYYMNFVSPATFDVTASLYMLMAVVIGGTGTVWGPILGSILIVFVPAWLQSLQSYELTIYGLALIFMIRFMPQGLVGVGKYFRRSKPVQSDGMHS